MSLPAGERKPGSVIPELLNHERQHGVKILCKALDYKALPDEWKKFTWASEDAIFPLLAVDDTVIWYGVPEFKGQLVSGFKSGKFYLKCPTCGNMDYLSKDDVNAYIDLNNITCPEHHCYIHASLGRYGLYIRCDCGHYVRLDQI